MTPELRTASNNLADWVRVALPFWVERGWEASGAWVEELALDGTALPDTVRRHRVQARQVYTYALATRQGWYDGSEVVRRTVDFMWDAGWAPDGEPGLIHRLNPDGSVASDLRDLYDHAFYLLALGWAEATVGGQAERVDKVWRFIEGLAHPAGGFAEGVPATLPRRQNPHMHLFETCLNLHLLGVEGDWLSQAGHLKSLFDDHFFDRPHKAVREYFGEQWEPRAGALEPGHAMEWVWLLGVWERITGGSARARDDLYQNAILSGGIWLWDETTPDWEPVRETSRLWVQTELLKAHLTQAEHGVPGAAEMAAAGIAGLLEVWLEPRGTWVDKRGACGQRISETIPTSTFYHIVTLVAEAERVARL